MWGDYAHMFLYLVISCLFSYEVAQHESFLGIRISQRTRHILLIFFSKSEKISFFCILSQMYAFVMISIFVVSRFCSLEFLYLVSKNPNALYTNMLKFHLIVIIPISMLEVGLRGLVKRLMLH